MSFTNVIRQRLEAGGKIKQFFLSGFYLLTSSLVLFSLTGCGPKISYPSDTVTRSVEDILLKEDKLEVEAQIAGKTLGALLIIETLMDAKGQVLKEVHEKMGQVMQALSRVSMSTDRRIDYCVAVLRDDKQGNELIVTRSVDDTRRAYAEAIGIEESINRTVFSQGQYDPAAERVEFKLKEVILERFLSDQIAQRIRFSLAKESKDPAENPFILADGSFIVTPEGKRNFNFSMVGFKSKDLHANILGMFKIVNEVFYGYHFSGFDSVELRDYLNRQKLTLDQRVFADFQAKKIKEQEILDRYLTESQSIQEAFKLFGFSLPVEQAGLPPDS